MTSSEDDIQPGDSGYKEAVIKAIEAIRARYDPSMQPEEKTREVSVISPRGRIDRQPSVISGINPRRSADSYSGVHRNDEVRKLLEEGVSTPEIQRRTGATRGAIQGLKSVIRRERIGQGLPPLPRSNKSKNKS